jgi:hypothetical protein
VEAANRSGGCSGFSLPLVHRALGVEIYIYTLEGFDELGRDE